MHQIDIRIAPDGDAGRRPSGGASTPPPRSPARRSWRRSTGGRSPPSRTTARSPSPTRSSRSAEAVAVLTERSAELRGERVAGSLRRWRRGERVPRRRRAERALPGAAAARGRAAGEVIAMAADEYASANAVARRSLERGRGGRLPRPARRGAARRRGALAPADAASSRTGGRWARSSSASVPRLPRFVTDFDVAVARAGARRRGRVPHGRRARAARRRRARVRGARRPPRVGRATSRCATASRSRPARCASPTASAGSAWPRRGPTAAGAARTRR